MQLTSIVVDTNVWATAGKSVADVDTIEEADCIEYCADWIQWFLESNCKILVDSEGKVIDEYQTYIGQGRLPESKLSQVYSELWGKLEFKVIQFDGSGYAILPEYISFHDLADRKFVALALTCEPYAPIYNSLDTDWAKEKQQLVENGLTIHELCPAYIEAIMSRA